MFSYAVIAMDRQAGGNDLPAPSAKTHYKERAKFTFDYILLSMMIK